MRRSVPGYLLTFLAIAFSVGCTSTGESGQEDTMTANVGRYSPPPSNLALKRAGVPPFLDAVGQNESGGASANLPGLAADQMTTLLVNSQRFDVIERAQLDQLLQEQGLEGIVDPNELARPNRVRGVDYLLIGKVTNFRVKTAESTTAFGLGKVIGPIGLGEVKNDSTEVTVECGVDLRVVDSTTGSVLAADFGEYRKTDTLNALGVDVLGASATADGDIRLSDDNQGKVLRLALDQCLRKMLPNLDRALLTRQR
jgi:curli biogenesis system outer membrane secretion channel CsgG